LTVRALAPWPDAAVVVVAAGFGFGVVVAGATDWPAGAPGSA
jgi:hypothetical protein